MKSILQNRWMMLILRLSLGVVLIAASISKIQDIAQFLDTIGSFGILPDSLTYIYGYVALWLELFIGCALILGIFVRFSAALSLPLIISFMVASGYAIANATGGSCGCFGTYLVPSHKVALTIDVLMFLASLILLFNNGKEFISVGQLIDRIHIKSKFLSLLVRLITILLVFYVIWFISIGAAHYA
jgi:uncharacterized membrane protein YphA (DoxX/SURF4 family)